MCGEPLKTRGARPSSWTMAYCLVDVGRGASIYVLAVKWGFPTKPQISKNAQCLPTTTITAYLPQLDRRKKRATVVPFVSLGGPQPALGRLETRLWVCESVLLSRMMFKPRFAAPCLSPGCNKSLQVTQLQFHRSTIRCQREMNNRIAMKRGLEDADHQSNNSGNTRKPVSHSRQGPGYKRIIFWNLA